MKKFSSSQKIGLVGLSFALAVASTPFIVSDFAYAAACPRNANQLTSAIRDRETDITLCDNISNASIDISSNRTYNYSIKLNGKNLTSNGTVIKVRPNSTLTISGSGVVTGNIDANASRLTITGGTYTSNPSNYVKDASLAVYKDGNRYHVLPKVNLDVSSATIAVRTGGDKNTSNITATATGATTPISYASDDTSVATVSDTGMVTGVGVGTATITVSTSVYDTSLSKEVSVEVLPELTNVTAPDATVGAGQNVTIAPTVEDASIPASFTYASADESIATVDADGKVTGVSNGKTTVTINASYTDKLGEMTQSTTINVSVFDVQAGTNDDEGVAADTVKDIVFNEGLPADMSDASDKIKEAFGTDYVNTGNNLKTAMNKGVLISTNVNVKESTDADAIAKINEALKNTETSGIKYYDITVTMMNGSSVIGPLKKLNNKLTVAVAEVENPASGFERQYFVVAYHEGDNEAIFLTEGEDYVIKDGKIYILSDRFSTFAVAYKDTPIQSEVITATTTKTPNTGIANEQSSAKASLVAPALMFGVLNILGIIGAIKLAKQ